MKPKFILFTLVSGAVLFTSCVSSKKFKASQAEVAQLHSRVDSLNKVLTDCNGTVDQLKTQNATAMKEAADCKAAKEAIAAKKSAIDKALAEQGTSIEDMRKRTEDALSKLNDAGATVTAKRGMLYVSMPDKLSYKKGSSNLSKSGKESLEVIAQIMNDNPDVKVIVVGNSDTLAYKKDGDFDNWSLSTERANTIVRTLRDKYQIDPIRITSAGRSKYEPIADNATKEGRAQNRRTDIVLVPDWSKLWEIIQTAGKD
jgi:chemotaxis protein MotB